MVDAVLLGIVIVTPFLCLIASLYLFAHFSHSDEQNFAKSWITRIFTIFIILFGMLQQFFLPLDISNTFSDGGLDLKFVFNAYYCALAFMLFIFLPFSTFYYETSEEISTMVRFRAALFKSTFYFFVVLAVILITYFVLNDENSKSFTIYVIAFQMIIGWFLLFFALGVGLIALPFDLIYSFIRRPKPMTQAEFKVETNILLSAISFIRMRCNEALEERLKVESQRGIKKWWNNSRLTRRVASLHSKSIILEDEYVRLVKISKYNVYIEPMAYYFKLALAILIIIVNSLLFVQLIGCQFLDPEHADTCKFKFLNTVIEAFSKQSNGFGFITTALIFLLSCHLTFSAFYGNKKLGLRFVVYTYAPLTPSETLYNNICYNVFLINLWSAAILQLLIQAFKTTLCDNGTEWCRIYYDNIDKLSFHKDMYDKSIFIYAMLAITALYGMYMFMYPDDKTFVLKSIEKKRKLYSKLKGNKPAEEPMLSKED